MQLKLIFALSLSLNVRVFGMVYSITVGGLNFIQERCFVTMNFVRLRNVLFLVYLWPTSAKAERDKIMKIDWISNLILSWEEDEKRSWKS